MTRPPPTPTLFPYTTLFRSYDDIERLYQELSGGAPALLAARDDRPVSVITKADLLEFVDRKSTRLNSSHGSISYAVFCLKKKRRFRSFRQKNFGRLQSAKCF